MLDVSRGLGDVVCDVLDLTDVVADGLYRVRDVAEEVADACGWRRLRFERREVGLEGRPRVHRMLRQIGHDLLLDELADLPGRLACLAGGESDRFVPFEIRGGGRHGLRFYRY